MLRPASRPRPAGVSPVRVGDIREVLAEFNPILRGWGAYFRIGNAATEFRQIDDYGVRRLRTLMIKRRGRNLALVSPCGGKKTGSTGPASTAYEAPSAIRRQRNHVKKIITKPDTGKPHVRIERGMGNQVTTDGGLAVARVSYHHGSLRQALIDGANEILTERGHDQFSLNEVARRAGVSTAAPYRHFATRDDLLSAVAELGYSLLSQTLDLAVKDTREPGEKLMQLGGAYVRFAGEHPGLFLTMFRSRPGGQTSAAGSSAFATLQQVVGDAQQAGDISSTAATPVLTRSIWATLHGLAVLHLQQPHERFGMNETPENLAGTTLSALLDLPFPSTLWKEVVNP